MFPLNLQKNIVQLDKQISLLENECKNMEVERKKKGFKPETSYTTCSKISSTRSKAPTMKVTIKKTDSSQKSKKPTPSAKLQSSSSLQPHCTKSWSDIVGDSLERKTKPCGQNTNIPLYSCQTLSSPRCKGRNENKHVKCVCCNHDPSTELNNSDSLIAQKDHVLHKELLFPNSGGAIEVTVTQKSNSGKENSPINEISPLRRSSIFENKIDKGLENCKCQIKGQKWSEILGNFSKQKELSSEKNKIIPDETKSIYQPLNFTNRRRVGENHSKQMQEDSFEMPVKLSSKSCNAKKQGESNGKKFEKEIQCSLESCCCGDPAKELKDSVKTFQFLINQIQQMSVEESKKSPENITYSKEQQKVSDPSKINSALIGAGENNTTYTNPVNHHCENLIKEKALLSEELQARDKAIVTMKKREEEYLSLIVCMKSNLEKTQKNAQEGMNALKEINVIRSKFLRQIKVLEALKQNHEKLQEILEHYYLQNEKLKTQVKILQLEAQKHEVLMTGKDAQIKRYKEEIQNFHRQISEHLASLKSNAEEINVEKMMEAIIQQSQVFAQTDIESIAEKDEKDSSKLQNVLMHSSPTSTKTSVVNSSWKQISSIHEQDQDQTKANSDTAIYLNDDKNKKNFFQLFGDNFLSNLASPKKEPSFEKLLEKRQLKRSSSFTSCLSAHADHMSSASSNGDSLVSGESVTSVEEKSAEELKKSSQISLAEAQNNIEELLKNMKQKFSKEIFETSLPSCTTEDFLNTSQISSVLP